MPDTTSLDLGNSPAAVYLTAALVALAREERKGKKPKRLVESDQATWIRFRGRMGVADFVDLLLEEAAVTQPEPFDAGAVLGLAHPSEQVSEEALAACVAALADSTQQLSEREYLDVQAAHLGVKARPAFSDLPKLEKNHRVLELPGTGGRLAAHLVQSRPALSFKEGFSIACATWQERMLAGIAAVDLGGKPRITMDPDLAEVRAASGAFTHVIGLRPDKGGLRDELELEGIFPGIEITLV